VWEEKSCGEGLGVVKGKRGTVHRREYDSIYSHSAVPCNDISTGVIYLALVLKPMVK